MINYFKKQWALFKAKSAFGKFTDVLLLALVIAFFTPNGRMWMQRLILKTGLMGGVELNMTEALRDSSLNWVIEDLEGRQFQFSELSGKPVFLNFWATWCPPCKAEMPSIESMKEAVGDDVNIVLVSYENPDKVKGFLKNQSWDLPVYFPVTAIPAQLQAQALPTSFIIDSKGFIVHRSTGMSDWSSEDVKALLLKL